MGFRNFESRWSGLRAGTVGLAMTCALLLTTATTSAEELPWLLQTVPLEVSAYPEAQDLDKHLDSANSAYQFLDTTKPLLLHMELLRRASTGPVGTTPAESRLLLDLLKKRYMADQNNGTKFFDYGYAQLVLEKNKNGLFFLRKANDQLGSPFTSLAYGIAQIDADRVFEHVPPDTLSTRKMDAGYKLKDALIYNKEDHLAGLWPSYIHVMEYLKSYPAFETLRTEDVTALYVPYGNMMLSASPERANQFLALDINESNPEIKQNTQAMTPNVETGCQFGTPALDPKRLVMSKSADLRGDGQSYAIDFFKFSDQEPYTVRVLGEGNHTVGYFKSYKAPYITEDLDHDGKFELVVRQFDRDPYHPLYVYRWNGSCYGEDKTVTRFFQ